MVLLCVRKRTTTVAKRRLGRSLHLRPDHRVCNVQFMDRVQIGSIPRSSERERRFCEDSWNVCSDFEWPKGTILKAIYLFEKVSGLRGTVLKAIGFSEKVIGPRILALVGLADCLVRDRIFRKLW
ncbi:hypothetical protein HAX54_028764 [Datura stramonium]|uniref:Uncharacterized protein n=1 Tax=Datura stramonium TaxID=4076 RepID=A0ABS8S9S4_DATST|nr:hypothetical protein [Datura stramonium]